MRCLLGIIQGSISQKANPPKALIGTIAVAKPTRFDGMMHEICVGMGFCGSVVDGKPRHVTDFIPSAGSVSADQFVLWLLEAEGMSELGAYSPHYDTLKAVFRKHMKGDFVEASSLVSGSS